MNDKVALTTIDKRDALRAKIEASERRNAERTLTEQAREAAEAATEYTRAHPLTVIGGAVAIGLLVGLATRPGRRVATRAAGAVGTAASGAASSAAAGVKGVAARGGTQLGTLIGDAALAWIMKLVDELLETARAGQDKVEDLGDDAGSAARRVRRDATQVVEAATDSARHTARKARRKATRAVRDTVSKIKS
jgi:ElaB/YqjD/DUF883 family membrane-anchored ribosome-binding protein